MILGFDFNFSQLHAGTSSFVKLNSPPFFWLLDLYDHIDEENSTATLKGRTVFFDLLKVSAFVGLQSLRFRR